MKMGIKTRLQ